MSTARIVFKFSRFVVQEFQQSLLHRVNQYRQAIFRTPDEVILERKYGSSIFAITLIYHDSEHIRVIDKCQLYNVVVRLGRPLQGIEPFGVDSCPPATYLREAVPRRF